MTQEQKSYVVFGATGAVGASLVRRLRRGGGRVLVAGRDSSRLRSLGDETESETIEFEAREPASITHVVARATELFGTIDGVANCVGSLLLKPAHLTTDEEWNDVIGVNLGSSFSILRASAKAMMRSGGAMVFVSSAAARLGLANHEAIAAAKAGIQGLVLSAAASYGARGIRVNAVAPGLVESPLTERITGNPKSVEASRAMHVLGRIGQPDEVASAAAWLLDPDQGWITGQILGVDGGLGSVRTRA